jgi:hypothetical protein
MKKLFPISVIVLALIILWLFLRFVVGGPEDDWICVDNQWVKHGVPAAPKPTTGCGDEVVDCQSYDLENCPEQCVVCPPCIECSSLNCQTKAFCQKFGIDRDWYEEMKKRISNFEDCIAAGNPAMESYPRQCRANNQTFVEDIGNELEKIDLIRVDRPRPNQTVTSPLEITGQARGYWFFEGDFPVKLIDDQGNVLAETYAITKSDWMTEDFVPFDFDLIFDSTGLTKGTLILERDNPSGLLENADELRVPVKFE